MDGVTFNISFTSHKNFVMDIKVILTSESKGFVAGFMFKINSDRGTLYCCGELEKWKNKRF